MTRRQLRDLVDPSADSADRRVHSADARRHLRLQTSEHHRPAGHGFSARHGDGRHAGRIRVAARNRSDPQDRKRGRDGRRHRTHHVDRHRRHVDDGDHVPPREEPVRSVERRARRGIEHPLRSAERSRRTDRRQSEHGGTTDPDVLGSVRPDGRRSAVVVRRRHGVAQAACRCRASARSYAHRRRRSRSAHRTRSGTTRGVESQRGRGVSSAAPHPATVVRRARRNRRFAPVDAHARNRQTRRRPERARHHVPRRPPHAARPDRDDPRHRCRPLAARAARRQAGRHRADPALARHQRRGRCRLRHAGDRRTGRGTPRRHVHAGQRLGRT